MIYIQIKTNEKFLEDLRNKNPYIFNKIEILENYKGNQEPIKCKCKKCGSIFYETPKKLYNLIECKKCKPKRNFADNKKLITEEFKKRVKDRFGDKIEFDIIGNYVNQRTLIECQCKKDKTHKFFRLPLKIMSGHLKCPICINQLLIPEKSIAYTAPWMLEFLEDKEDAYKYNEKSGKKINFKCPVCGETKNLYIYQVSTQGFSCTCCGKGQSTPNKILFGLMQELLNNNLIKEFKREYTPNWFGKHKYRYDGYIKLLNDKEILLEFDGIQHFDKNNQYYSENRVKIDKIKDKEAKNRNKKVIRINCKKVEFSYIKRNFKQ